MLEYVSLALLVVMITFVIFLVIYIHDIPYEIAKERGHPHQDAIHIAGWVSLFLLHTIWPLLWIWAYLYKPGESFLQMEVSGAGSDKQAEKIDLLESKIGELTAALEDLRGSVAQVPVGEKPND